MTSFPQSLFLRLSESEREKLSLSLSANERLNEGRNQGASQSKDLSYLLDHPDLSKA